MELALFGTSALMSLVSSTVLSRLYMWPWLPTAIVPPLLATHALIFGLLLRPGVGTPLRSDRSVPRGRCLPHRDRRAPPVDRVTGLLHDVASLCRSTQRLADDDSKRSD